MDWERKIIIVLSNYFTIIIIILEYRLSKRKDFCYNEDSEYNNRNIFKVYLKINMSC